MTRTGIWSKIDIAMRALIPFLSVVGFAILGSVPLYVPDYALITPAWTLMAVYYWTIYRPELLPATAIFLVGLLQDTLAGGMIGLSAFSLLFVFGIVVSQRPILHGKSFAVIWWGFMLIASGASFINWLVVSLMVRMPIDPESVIASTVMTIALYPLMVLLLSNIHKAAPPQAGQD